MNAVDYDRGPSRGYVAAISVVHQAAGYPNPTVSEAVRRTMARVLRRPVSRCCRSGDVAVVI